MKLVDILARELDQWPEGVEKIMQTFAGMIFYQDCTGQMVPLARITLADDWRSDEGVTRPQWQAEVDRLKSGASMIQSLSLNSKEKAVDIDWSKAPEGATHYYPKSNGYNAHWFKSGHFCVVGLEDRGWIEDFLTEADPNSIPRPVELFGQGLPPVGTHVYIYDATGTLRYGHGEDGEVVAHVENTAVVRMSYGLGCFEADYLRTAEQIAKDEREVALKDACKIVGCSVGSTYGKIIEQVINAGYRKQVQG